MRSIASIFLIIAGLALTTFGGYRALDQASQPSIGRVEFRFELPDDVQAGNQYAAPLVVRNNNARPFVIYGGRVC